MPFRNILVAFSGSAASHVALTVAADLAARDNARLTVFTAVESPPAVLHFGLAIVGECDSKPDAETAAEEICRSGCRRVSDAVSVTGVIGTAHARTSLIREVERAGYDLVVLGSRGRRLLGMRPRRRVMTSVLQRSTSLILVARSGSLPACLDGSIPFASDSFDESDSLRNVGSGGDRDRVDPRESRGLQVGHH